jgi:hypothetical protein
MTKRGILSVAILSGVGLFGYSIYRFYKKQIDLLKQFKWKILTFKVNKITPQFINGSITFKFDSISDLEILVQKFSLDVFVNGKEAGYINETKEFIIPARGFNNIEINFNILPQPIFTNAIDIIFSSSKLNDATIDIVGYVKVKSGFISTTVPINCSCSVKNFDCNCQ